MTMEWAPSLWGQHLTGSPKWRLCLQGFELSLTVAGKTTGVAVEDESSYRVHRGLVWTDITLHPGCSTEVKVDGLPNGRGAAFVSAMEAERAEKRVRENVAFLERTHEATSDWWHRKREAEKSAEIERRWITHEEQMVLNASIPAVDASDVLARLKRPGVLARLSEGAKGLNDAMGVWIFGDRDDWSACNARHTKRELVACKGLFDRVESKPLTEEQARAVICFDNRVQVVAAAGSGKTSTMVAKAAYAIHRGFVEPERIVMLAFNKKAAVELKERAARSFERLGMDGVSVEASTFHALGLGIIGKATGEKPDIPDWATDTAGGFRKILDIVDQLKDSSPDFRTKWDLFRFAFSQDLASFGSQGEPNVWDKDGDGRILTANGECVRSQEEALICNWLFCHGVDYVYEISYKFNTADEDHRQYHPDFYYPNIDLYHEHFALDATGKAPPRFDGYVQGVEWKRQLHEERGTSLIETTSHQIRTGEAFAILAQELTQRGIQLDFNPNRPIPAGGQEPMENTELAGLVRIFISHAKSNCLTVPDLRQRLKDMPEDTFKHRHRMFLDLFAPILEAWDSALAAEGGIDFEDMLNMAADLLESGRYEAPYELVMADEFQDASRARARLCRALVKKPGRFFFAVGDDWQSINRFAGSDVSVMTGFREWFGHGQVLKLERTFRCPQELCDISSQFVSKNPAQIGKQVRSGTQAAGPALQAFQVGQKNKLADAVNQFLERLCQGVRDGTIPPGRNGKINVFILGRYNADRKYLTSRKNRFDRWMDVSFLTIHRSKGSEADYVILPEMLSLPRGRSFPNTRADDPVLTLAMPASDGFPLGEERRLFYVALTRARRGVIFFTACGQRSTFIKELEDDGMVEVTDTDGKVINETSCPACKQGVLIVRSGPYGKFRSCSNFPVCRYKPKRVAAASTSATEAAKRLFGTVTTVASSSPARTNAFPDSISAKRPDPSPASTSSTPRSGLTGFFQSINKGVEQFNSTMNRILAVQRATSDLKSSIHTEKVVVETALNVARDHLETQERLKDPAFRAAYERVSKAMPTFNDDVQNLGGAIPTFERTTKNSDPEIECIIQTEIAGLKSEREAFLSAVHSELSNNAVLYGYFLEAMTGFKGNHYLAGTDPHKSLDRSTVN